MKYYLIAGEASGDLHASHLMKALRRYDSNAEFRFFGGDNMVAAGGTLVRHYKDTAFMGFLPVLLHLGTIFKNLALCKRDILEWQPDVVIPVDYAGFNLKIAKFLKSETDIPVFYYISPKIWAWKEGRIKNFKRDVDEMFCILPFEREFFEKKHDYPVHYVGNPTADEVRRFRLEYKETHEEFCLHHGLNPEKPIVALLAGSRKHEIKDNLPAMIHAVHSFHEKYQFVLACAPSVDMETYEQVMFAHLDTSTPDAEDGCTIRREIHILPYEKVCCGSTTYALLSHSVAALVTSGTATLETACFDVPQVVCYKTVLPHIYSWGFRHIIKCDYISLVNLIAGREVVAELFAARFSVDNISRELSAILPGGSKREKMIDDYREVQMHLGDTSAPDDCAKTMTSLLFADKTIGK